METFKRRGRGHEVEMEENVVDIYILNNMVCEFRRLLEPKDSDSSHYEMDDSQYNYETSYQE